MPDTIPEVPAQTPDEIIKKAEEYRNDLINSIVPQVIVNRLVQKHGHVIKTAAEANKAVEAAVELFHMHQAGLIAPFEEQESQDSPLVKAANEVLSLRETLRNQYDEQAVANHFLGNEEVMKTAMQYVQTQL